MSLDELERRIAFVRSAIERNAEQSRAIAAGRVSGFWAEIFGRRLNYPDINALMVCRREGIIESIGDDPQGSLERERAYSARVHHLFKGMVDGQFMARLPETSFGSPLVFEHDGIVRSANFWINAATARRVVDFVERFGKKSPLRVLEIGPGWGACVYQLHQVLNIESYTLVDLPENLYISTIHLGTTLPDRRLGFVDVAGEPVSAIESSTITACLPGAIRRLQAKYDLVVNSFSLQEMSLESVREYIDWIASVLAPGGIFASLNSHNKTDLVQPSDYRYEKFHIHHWGVFRPAPAGFFNTVPYEVVVGPRTDHSPVYRTDCQNGLGWLMQTGLDAELKDHSAALVAGTLTSGQEAMLSTYARFFDAKTDSERLSLLGNLGELDASPILPYVTALFALARSEFVKARPLLLAANDKGLSGFARMRSDLYLAGMTHKEGRQLAVPPRNGIDPLFAYPEAEKITQGHFDHVVDHANRTLRRRPA